MVRSHYLSLLEQARALLVEYLRSDRLSADNLLKLEGLMRGSIFRQLPESSHSHLESSFVLLRTGLTALTRAAHGQRERALAELRSSLTRVEAFDGDEDPFDGLLFALGARLALELGEDELRENLVRKLVRFAERNPEKAHLLDLMLEEIGSGAEKEHDSR